MRTFPTKLPISGSRRLSLARRTGCHFECWPSGTEGHAGIEKANPETLYGIFGDAQWTNKDRLSDALLRDLIEHFSRITLGNKAAEADVLGQSYEYLVKKFADITNKKAGEFYTPRAVVKLMVNILDPKEVGSKTPGSDQAKLQ